MRARSVRRFKETVEFRSLPFKQLRSHRYFPATVLVLVVLVAACVHIWQRVIVISLVKEVAALQRENRGLVDAGHKIQTDIASLSMSTRIEGYAVDTLGLQRVSPERFYTLIPRSTGERTTDELTTMISSIKRVVQFFPVVTDAQAAAQELEPIKFEDDYTEGTGQ